MLASVSCTIKNAAPLEDELDEELDDELEEELDDELEEDDELEDELEVGDVAPPHAVNPTRNNNGKAAFNIVNSLLFWLHLRQKIPRITGAILST